MQEPGTSAGHAVRTGRLSEYLSDSADGPLSLSFTEIERLLGFGLPAFAITPRLVEEQLNRERRVGWGVHGVVEEPLMDRKHVVQSYGPLEETLEWTRSAGEQFTANLSAENDHPHDTFMP